MLYTLMALFLSVQIAVMPTIAYAGLSGQLTKDLVDTTKDITKTAIKTEVEVNIGKRIGPRIISKANYIVQILEEDGEDREAAIAAGIKLIAGLEVFALAFNQILYDSAQLAGIQHTEAEKTEDYIHRLWGYYLSDPEYVSKISGIFQQATDLVNSACEKKGYGCRVDPRQVFLSPIYTAQVEPGSVAGQRTCVFEVPGDDLITNNPVQAVAIHLAEEVGLCHQIPTVINDIQNKYNNDGSIRHFYSPYDVLSFYKATSLFALALLDLPTEMPVNSETRNTEYFNTVLPQKYFNVEGAFLHYATDFNNRNKQGKIFDTSAEALINHGLEVRVLKIPYIYEADTLVLSACGRDGIERFFYESLVPCQQIIPGKVLEAKIDKILDTNRGTTTQFGNLVDKASRALKLKEFGRYIVDMAGGTLFDFILLDIVGKKLRAGKQAGKVAVDLGKVVEEEAAPIVAKSTLWKSFKNWVVVQWTGKTIKFVTRVGVANATFMVGMATTDWELFGKKIHLDLPEDTNAEIDLLNSLAHDSRFYDTGDKPNDADASQTYKEFSKVLSTSNKVTIKVVTSLAEDSKRTSESSPN